MKKPFDFTTVDEILERYPKHERSTIAILQDIQEVYHYLPEEIFPYVAKAIGVGEARLYGAATFYENFSLEAKGKYVIRCCDGTACHVRGSVPILNRLRELLDRHERQNRRCENDRDDQRKIRFDQDAAAAFSAAGELQRDHEARALSAEKLAPRERFGLLVRHVKHGIARGCPFRLVLAQRARLAFEQLRDRALGLQIAEQLEIRMDLRIRDATL